MCMRLHDRSTTLAVTERDLVVRGLDEQPLALQLSQHTLTGLETILPGKRSRVLVQDGAIVHDVDRRQPADC